MYGISHDEDYDGPVTVIEYCSDRNFCAGAYSPNQTCHGHGVTRSQYE